MSQNMSSTLAKSAAAAALSSLLALGLSACHKQEAYVKCYGVSKQGADQWIGMTPGQCKKLASSKAMPITPDEMKSVTKYTTDDYIKCYGVAAASMNDCGTKTSACGGTIAQPHSPDAWIAIPKGICEQVKGGVVVVPKKS